MGTPSQFNCSTVDDTISFVYMNSFNCTNETDDSLNSTFRLPLLVRTLQAMTYIFLLIFGLSLNVFLICLILCRNSLHQRGFVVAIQILLTNVAFTIPVLSTSTHVALAGDWTLGDGSCQFIAFCHQSFQPQRWLLTAVLVIDRTLTVNRPLKYEKHGAKFVAIMSTVALVAGLLVGILPPSVLHTCNGYLPGVNTCHFTNSHRGCGVYVVSYSTVILVLGGVLPFGLYIWMFCKAKKASRQIIPTHHMRLSTAPSHLSTSRKQITTVFLLFWTLLGCLLPHYFAFLLAYLSIVFGSIKALIAGYYGLILTQPLYYGLVIADPIALMWHKDVKKELKKIKHTIRNILGTYLKVTTSPSPSTT